MEYEAMTKFRLARLLKERNPFVKYVYTMTKDELLECLRKLDKEAADKLNAAMLGCCHMCRKKLEEEALHVSPDQE